jgi:SPP1 gp7 family putative phage head morphogenesis protein
MIFRLSARKQASVKAAILIQEAIVNRFAALVLLELRGTISKVLDAALDGGKMPEINLDGIDVVAKDFLLTTIRQAFIHARHQKHADLPVKRLAAYPKAKIPLDSRSLRDLFRNRKAWDVMLKRNRKYANGIKRAYLQKLRRHFNEVMPKVLSGEMTLAEAKQGLEKAVNATGPRVTTAFRTETTNYFAEAQVSYFSSDPEILGFLFDSVLDSARSKICRSRHGMVLLPGTAALKKNTPSCHPNCRSHLIPLADTPENRKLVKESSRQPENRSLVPLPKGWRSAA